MAAVKVASPKSELAITSGGLAAAKAALEMEAFARAWAQGQAMTVEQAVAYALGC